MPNIKLTLAYDGTDYAGWQVQPNYPTVQETVQRAIEKLTGERANVIASGRTDSGVHALGQVANFHTESRIPADRWMPALNSELPHDIVVRHAEEVDAEFHATYAAKQKTYRYMIDTGPTRNPFVRRYSYHVVNTLDVQAMQEAATFLVGKHDFRCFETEFPNRASSVRTIYDLRLLRVASLPTWHDIELVSASDGDFVALEVTADGFLYNMVRAIAGTLLQVGLRRWPAEIVRTILETGERKDAGPTAPACGLFLIHVEYSAVSRDETRSASPCDE